MSRFKQLKLNNGNNIKAEKCRLRVFFYRFHKLNFIKRSDHILGDKSFKHL